MKKYFLTAFFFSVLFTGIAQAEHDVLLVQSVRIKPYDEAVRGFKSAHNFNIKRLIISDMDGAEVVRAVRNTRPDIILAVGMDALLSVRKIKDIPIVYLMVLNPPPASDDENITGITMAVPPERQITLMKTALPHLKRVGVLYSTAKTGAAVKKASSAAASLGIEIVAEEVGGAKDVPRVIAGMRGRIDAFWMLPDTAVVTPETAEFLLLFSLENKIPILAFSEKYAEKGALMALDIDPFDIGKQAGEAAAKILSGTPPNKIPVENPRNVILVINLKVAGKMGTEINRDVMNLNKTRIIK